MAPGRPSSGRLRVRCGPWQHKSTCTCTTTCWLLSSGITGTQAASASGTLHWQRLHYHCHCHWAIATCRASGSCLRLPVTVTTVLYSISCTPVFRARRARDFCCLLMFCIPSFFFEELEEVTIICFAPSAPSFSKFCTPPRQGPPSTNFPLNERKIVTKSRFLAHFESFTGLNAIRKEIIA